MKLRSLELENYRGFAKVDLRLDGNSALIIGKNGAGKSTILDAIATALAPLYKEFMQEKSTIHSLQELDVRLGTIEAQIKVNLEQNTNIFEWKIVRNLERKGQSIRNVTDISILAEQFRVSIVQNRLMEEKNGIPDRSIPILAYYPANRAVSETTVSRLAVYKSFRFQNATSWEEALSVGVDFQSFFHWFRNQEDIENEMRRYQNPQYVDAKLQAVRNAIETFIPQFTHLRYTRVAIERMLVDKDGVTFAVNQLSSGEKMMLALVGDLARRLAIANPALENPLTGEGLILIDEVEAHLHPGWQRMIINGFRRTFPNVQFLFTTHSPQVISEVRDLKMYLLDTVDGENKVSIRKPVFGQDVNYVLEALMDTESRNVDVQNHLYSIFRHLAMNELNEAEHELHELESLLNGLEKPADMLKAEATLLRKRTIGR